MLPWRLWEDALGPLSMNFSTWIAAGLMIVVGAVWVIVFNADVLLGLAMRVLGRIRSLAPVLKISMAYPLANRFRTGTTLAMFTLVVFTLVTGTVSNGSFIHASENEETFGGRVRRPGEHERDDADHRRRAGRRRTPRAPADEVTVAASQSFLPIEATADRHGRELEPYVVRGLDRRLPRPHDLRPGQDRRGVRLLARGLGGGRLPAQPRGRGQHGRPQAGQLGLRGARGLPPDRLLLRRGHVRAGPGRGPRPRRARPSS